MESKYCKWAFYKDLWHKECCGFFTTTNWGEINYTSEEIPMDRRCPECRREIEVDEDKQFGRNR